MKALVITALRLRKAPNLKAAVVRMLERGETVAVGANRVNVDGYRWAQVTASDGKQGWCADRWLRLIDEVQPNAVGIHVAGTGDIGDLLNVAARLHAAGRPIPLAVVVSDPGLVGAIKQRSPSTTVVYRWVASAEDGGPFDRLRADGSGDVVDPGAWFYELWRRHSQAPQADFHQMYNECAFGGNAQSPAYARRVAEWELAFMQRADEVGAKVTIGNFMPGVPEQHHVDPMREAWRYAEQHGHALCYHAYTSAQNDASFQIDAQWYALRWVPFVAPFPKLKVILGEAGYYHSPRFRGEADMLTRMKELNAMLQPLREAGREVRAAYWTIRGQGDPQWRVDDWTASLPAYERWLKEGI